MMLRRLLMAYLSSSSRERNGFMILLSLMGVMILLRVLLPGWIRPEPTAQVLPADEGHPPGDAAPATTQRNRPGVGLRPGAGSDGHFPPGEARPARIPPRETKPQMFEFELNRADTTVLKTVYGIGPVFANRIVKYRELLGGYYAIEQLREVYGLNEEQYSELSRRCHADTTGLRTLDLNSATRSELARHPYLDAYQADALVAYRRTMGSFRSLQEIPVNRLLPGEVFSKVRPYLEVP